MAKSCGIAECQAPAQAFLRPGVWLPLVRDLHRARESWSLQATPDECLEDLLKGVNAIEEKWDFTVHKVDREKHFVELFSFTSTYNWLDVVEIEFQEGEQSGTTTASAHSFSSGFLPACCPCSFVANVFLFWVPFYDSGLNSRRLDAIREAMQLDVDIVITGGGKSKED